MSRMEGQTSSVLLAQAWLDFIGAEKPRERRWGKKSQGTSQGSPHENRCLVPVEHRRRQQPHAPTVVGALYQELFLTELHHQLPREYFV